jgi:hypothetical protein
VKIKIPKDAPKGTYEILLNRIGNYRFFSDKTTPTVIHTNNNFILSANRELDRKLKKYYFQVPTNTINAQIIVDRPTLIYQPNGELLTVTPQTGIINIPNNVRGIYSLETQSQDKITDCGSIKTVGFDTYFSTDKDFLYKIFFEDPSNYKIPTTQIREDFRGLTLATNGTNIFINGIPNTIMYRYRITRTDTGKVTIYDRNTNRFNLIIAGASPVSKKQYLIEVATMRDINEGFGNYGTSYSIFTP